jgi:hypothetical protein
LAKYARDVRNSIKIKVGDHRCIDVCIAQSRR